MSAPAALGCGWGWSDQVGGSARSAPLAGGHGDGTPAGHGAAGHSHVADDLDRASRLAVAGRHAHRGHHTYDAGARTAHGGAGAEGADRDRSTTHGRHRTATGRGVLRVAVTAGVAAVAAPATGIAVALPVAVPVAVPVPATVDVGQAPGVTPGDRVLPAR